MAQTTSDTARIRGNLRTGIRSRKSMPPAMQPPIFSHSAGRKIESLSTDSSLVTIRRRPRS
ncbi:MAG TPA: hypothetical protein PK181_02055, partial [Methanothrix soehngenii]|nr:hypothetical protein [Methanothrix soehngenii]